MTNDGKNDEMLMHVARLTRDLKQAATTLSTREARFLVDQYYIMQENRLRTESQARTLAQFGEPHGVLLWMGKQFDTMENQLKGALDKYSAAHPVGQWMRGITGIGPVIAAGFLAHIDIKKAPTAGHIWRFAGLDPTQIWGKGQRRPWNASLKVLCWKLGESFVKVQNHEDDVYGKIYVAQRKIYDERNAAGEYAERAAQKLREKRIGTDTEAYKHLSQGRLPPAHIYLMAKRHTVKLFISHLHHVWYRHEFKVNPPLPYAIEILKHAHYIPPIAAE